MMIIALPRTLAKHAAEGSLPQTVCPVPAGVQQRTSSFAAKIRLTSNVTCKEEEFNVWHANADKTVASFVWGGIAKSVE